MSRQASYRCQWSACSKLAVQHPKRKKSYQSSYPVLCKSLIDSHTWSGGCHLSNIQRKASLDHIPRQGSHHIQEQVPMDNASFFTATRPHVIQIAQAELPFSSNQTCFLTPRNVSRRFVFCCCCCCCFLKGILTTGFKILKDLRKKQFKTTFQGQTWLRGLMDQVMSISPGCKQTPAFQVAVAEWLSDWGATTPCYT